MPRKTHDQRIEELEDRFKRHMADYEEVRSKSIDTNDKITKLNDFLLGSEYDEKLNGGFIICIQNNLEDVRQLKRWRNRLIGAWGLLIGLLSFISMYITIQWNNIRQGFIDDIIYQIKDLI